MGCVFFWWWLVYGTKDVMEIIYIWSSVEWTLLFQSKNKRNETRQKRESGQDWPTKKSSSVHPSSCGSEVESGVISNGTKLCHQQLHHTTAPPTNQPSTSSLSNFVLCQFRRLSGTTEFPQKTIFLCLLCLGVL